MLITLPRPLELDIMEFCRMNNVTEINSFLVTCLRNGYNIVKYGISPQDNFNSQNKPLEIKELNYDSKEKVDVGQSNTTEPTKKKRPGRPKKISKEVEQPKEEEKVKNDVVEETSPVIKKTKRSIKIIKN